MPNWIKNEISIKGDATELKGFIETICGENGAVDFNKFVAMDKTLRITSGSSSDCAMLLAIENQYGSDVSMWPEDATLLARSCYFFNTDTSALRDHLAKIKCNFPDLPESEDKSYLFETYGGTAKSLADAIFLGKVMIANVRRYGSKDWYDWSYKYWGTKWNAYEPRVNHISNCEIKIDFDTANSAPMPIFHKMQEMFPTLSFSGRYADEDVGGMNFGLWIAENGIWDEPDAPATLPYEIWGIDPDES